MAEPEVSVVIPSYNAARYLPAAIESVLGQSFLSPEVIVVDDGSTDDTEGLMRRSGSRIQYIRQENSGVSVARNRGIQESRGRYVAFLDADDTWLPAKLERQLLALRAQPAYRACYSAYTVVDPELQPRSVHPSRRRGSTLEDLLTLGNVIGSVCTVICDRTLFAKAGVFDPELSQCADWDMWIRLARLTEFLYLDEPLVTYRQHENNMSRNPALLERDSLRVLKKGFDMPDLPPALQRERARAYARNYMVLAGSYFHSGHPSSFIRCAVRALALDLRQARHILAFPARALVRLRGTQVPPMVTRR